MSVTRRINLEENVTKAAQRIADALSGALKVERDYANAINYAQHIADTRRRASDEIKKAQLDADKATKEARRITDALRSASKIELDVANAIEYARHIADARRRAELDVAIASIRVVAL